jgi:riboflavin transporter FmnP
VYIFLFNLIQEGIFMDYKKKISVKTLAILGMLCALAYVVMFYSRSLPPITPMPPLKYDPKDIFIIIGGFLFGPFAAVAMSMVVSLIEMVTVSTTGPYGLLMNVVSTCAFAFPAAAIYGKSRTIKGAVAGLAAGVMLVVATMMLWNYIITPIYTGFPRAAVVSMLIPVFLPFNLLKASLNAALIMLIYKPLSAALRKTNFLPEAETKGKANLSVIFASLFAVLTCVLLMLVFSGVI